MDAIIFLWILELRCCCSAATHRHQSAAGPSGLSPSLRPAADWCLCVADCSPGVQIRLRIGACARGELFFFYLSLVWSCCFAVVWIYCFAVVWICCFIVICICCLATVYQWCEYI